MGRVSSGHVAAAGQITDEGVARLRARIGIPEPHPMPPYYTLPTIDTFRNVAVAYGDDNPLWCDPEYGLKTRWASPIASPVLVGGDTLIGEDEVTAVAPEHVELGDARVVQNRLIDRRRTGKCRHALFDDALHHLIDVEDRVRDDRRALDERRDDARVQPE